MDITNVIFIVTACCLLLGMSAFLLQEAAEEESKFYYSLAKSACKLHKWDDTGTENPPRCVTCGFRPTVGE